MKRSDKRSKSHVILFRFVHIAACSPCSLSSRIQEGPCGCCCRGSQLRIIECNGLVVAFGVSVVAYNKIPNTVQKKNLKSAILAIDSIRLLLCAVRSAQCSLSRQSRRHPWRAFRWSPLDRCCSRVILNLLRESDFV